MSQLQFSKRQYVNVLTTNELIQAGSFESVTDFEVTRIFPMVYFNNVNPALERIRCIIYSNASYDTVVYTSDWYIFADLATIGPYGRWYIPISFNRFNIKAGVTYYLAFEIANYTKTLGSYIGIEYDLMDAIRTTETLIVNSPFRYLMEGYAKPIQYR